MRVSEAVEKWCPFAQVSRLNKGHMVTMNRQSNGSKDSGCRCIATDCMLWRTTKYAHRNTCDGKYFEEEGHCGANGNSYVIGD